MNYNYKILILKGWRDLKEKKFLDRYFYKEFKKAERDLFIKADEYFEGCFHWIKQFEAVIAEDLGNNEPINERYVNFSRDSSLLGLYGFKLYFDDITSIKEALQSAYNILLEELKNKTSSESIKQPEQSSISKKEQTKSDKLRSELTKYNFFELPLVKQISTENQAKLVELINSKKIPYAIAVLDFLGFIKYLEKEYFPIKYKLYTEISNWFNSDSRNIKGNISSLLVNSTEDKKRYTAYLHKETVVKDYQNLK